MYISFLYALPAASLGHVVCDCIMDFVIPDAESERSDMSPVLMMSPWS